MIGLVDGNNFFVSCERVVDPKLNGRPVAVLSNNDGCCVSRSNEFKALGISMGTPAYQLRDRERAGEIVLRSSNYELYGDLSRRIVSILRDMAVDVEQYSIDEAFIYPPLAAGMKNEPEERRTEWLLDYGRRVRARVLQWVGIPCGVGFAPTKTLAKIANHIGKKRPGGVFVMPDDPTPILAELPVGEVWGVGRRLPLKLRAERIFTAKDLRDAPDDVVRAVGGVVLLRTAMELRGIVCNQDRDYGAAPDSISCSRSFGEQVTTETALMESIASFTAQAAVKLRRHGMLAAGCNVYAQVATAGMFEKGVDAWSESFYGYTVAFPQPTDATNVMLKTIREEIGSLFVPGTRYRKSGIVFFGLEKAGAAYQTDLFDVKTHEKSDLYKTIDAINARFGRGKVFSAAEGVGSPSWKMRRSRLSRRATTSWDELLTVR